MERSKRVNIPLTIFLGMGFLSTCQGFPSSTPDTACGDMTPVHNLDHLPLSPQNGSAPFEVKVDKQKFGKGTDVQVTINGSVEFHGFFIQARLGCEEKPIGRFSNLTEKMGFVNCSDAYPEAAVTHVNQSRRYRVPFKSVELTWTAPEYTTENVIFYATVVQNYYTFWVKLASEEPTCDGFTVLSPTPSLLLLPVAAMFSGYL